MTIDESSIDLTFQAMQKKLSAIVPQAELRIKAELVYEINRLKKERGAIILGHNYMEPALFHTVPDIVGDSLELSRKAAQTDKDPIIFWPKQRKFLIPTRLSCCRLKSPVVRWLRA